MPVTFDPFFVDMNKDGNRKPDFLRNAMINSFQVILLKSIIVIKEFNTSSNFRGKFNG
jgi:hypothetical protein